MSSETAVQPELPVEVGPARAAPQLHQVGRVPLASAEAPVISVANVGKCYHIYQRPQDRLKQAISRWKRRYYQEFWALRRVSFEIFRGDSLGILGRNGSGKSTLLQMIAGTLTPTEGEVCVRGRIAAMLELGSGFNPDFTGRENVFLYGSILGITRREMEARFDSIASFADIGDFMDQPLKTYSSGMAARLAFSVAISIEPDVMIVDEILAVGDIGFQQRCLARLRRLRDNGLTLLFVSHSPDAVRSVCDKALFLEGGQPVFFGHAERATDQYLAYVRERSNEEQLKSQDDLARPIGYTTHLPGNTRYGTGHVQIERVQLLNASGEPCRAFGLDETVILEADLRSHIDTANVSVSFLVRDATGVDLMGTTTFDERVELPHLAAGRSVRVRFRFVCRLHPGGFGISLAVNRVARRDYSDNVLFDQVDGCAAFSVVGDPSRPVHYKFHQPVEIQWEQGVDAKP